MAMAHEPSRPPGRGRVLALALAVELGLAVLALPLAGWLGIDPLARLRVTAAGTFWGVLGTAPLLGSLPWLLGSTWPPLRGIRELLEAHLLPLFARSRLVDLALVSAAAGLGEELLFRGVAQPALQSVLGTGPGLVAASLLFGLAHAVSRAYVVFATLFGVYLGGVVLLTGELWPAIVAHGLYDLVALQLLLRRRPG